MSSPLHSPLPGGTAGGPAARGRLPRLAGAAVERARLSVVPRQRVQRTRVPFVTLVTMLLVGGVVGLLLFNTSMQQASFAATALEGQARTLAAREQSLRTDLEGLRDPQRLAERATRMGMVLPTAPCFLHSGTGLVEGACSPATPEGALPVALPRPPKPAVLTPPPVVVTAEPPAAEVSGTRAGNRNGNRNGNGNRAGNRAGDRNGTRAGTEARSGRRDTSARNRADGARGSRQGPQASQQSQQSSQSTTRSTTRR